MFKIQSIPKSRATLNTSVKTVTKRCTQRLLNDEGQSSESKFSTKSDGFVIERLRAESRMKRRDYAIACPILNKVYL